MHLLGSDQTGLARAKHASSIHDQNRQEELLPTRKTPYSHQYAVKQGEHYFENFSQTVRWPNIRAICAQACINGFTYAKQIDTGAAFLKELGDILGYQKMGEIQLIYIPTSKNTADALTKPLAKHKFLEHRNLIVRESAAWGGVKADKPP